MAAFLQGTAARFSVDDSCLNVSAAKQCVQTSPISRDDSFVGSRASIARKSFFAGSAPIAVQPNDGDVESSEKTFEMIPAVAYYRRYYRDPYMWGGFDGIRGRGYGYGGYGYGGYGYGGYGGYGYPYYGNSWLDYEMEYMYGPYRRFRDDMYYGDYWYDNSYWNDSYGYDRWLDHWDHSYYYGGPRLGGSRRYALAGSPRHALGGW